MLVSWEWRSPEPFCSRRGVLSPRRRESILCPCLWDVDDQITLTRPMYHCVPIYQLTPIQRSAVAGIPPEQMQRFRTA